MSFQPSQLTIAIPSWNRLTRLLLTLESICNQPESRQVNLLVLDNGSDQEYTPAVNFLREKKQPFRYVRHEQNIGMCSNILRCVEESETEWIWILGDDDPVAEDSLERILSEVNQANCEDIICFSEAVRLGSSFGPSLKTVNFEKYLQLPGSLTAICGISENIFRRATFVAVLSHGYHYATTLFPHLVVAFAIMSNGGSVAFKSATLLQSKNIDAVDRWYWPSWDLGVGLLLDLPFLKAIERKKIKVKLTELSTKKALFIHSVAMLAAGFDRSFVVYVYSQSAFRTFGFWSTVFSPYTYGMLGATVAPKLASRILGIIYRLARKRTPFHYYTESMKSKRVN